MPKRPRAYPLEFRQKILELVQSGSRVDDLVAKFDLGTQTIRNWLKQADLDTGSRTDGLTSEERTELSKLRREIKRPEIENEILSKAAAWFARETDVIPKRSTIREEQPGLSRCNAVPHVGRLHKRLLRMAPSRSICTGMRRLDVG